MQVQPLPTTPLPPTQRPSVPNRPLHSQGLKPGQLPKKKIQRKAPILIALIALALLLAVVASQLLSSQIQTDRYQAVFLNNGQVYFGKLHGYNGNKPYMTNVYYFQADSQSQPGASSDVSQLLVKLGSELHGPEGKLILNKDAILFVENLTEKSKVTEAIKKESQEANSEIKPTEGSGR